MSRVAVALGQRSHEVVIEPGLVDCAGACIADVASDGRLFVVSDTNVWKAQGDRLLQGLHPCTADVVLLPAGEPSKSWAELGRLVDRLLECGIGRDDWIIAFGGGVVGDLAGFAAAIVKRGCGLIQVPTSLLAQVDSSVGGKTGINVAAGKNLVGAFHHPSLVLIDPQLLETLPDRHLRAGYAEVVKYGLIGDPAFFAWCEAEAGDLLARDPDALTYAIHTCVAAKAAIVAEDERDRTGRRALLNFGHTFGHALEAEAGFSDRLLHGEAVAIGMMLALRFSARRGLIPADEVHRIEAHLLSAGLPTRWAVDPSALIGPIAQDKKAQGGRVAFILSRGIGSAFVDRCIALDDVAQFLADEASEPAKAGSPAS